MKEAVMLRFFYDENRAKKAVELIRLEGFECEVVEDKFNTATLDKFGMRRRFRVIVELEDYNELAEVLAKKLKRGRIG